MVAAKNYLLPQLNAVAKYDFLGLGNQLVAAGSQLDTSVAANREAYALNNMLLGDYQQWTLGLEFKMPLGFRKEMTNVRNAELRLARERALLQEQEWSCRTSWHSQSAIWTRTTCSAKTNLNRRLAAQREVEASLAAYEARSGRTPPPSSSVCCCRPNATCTGPRPITTTRWCSTTRRLFRSTTARVRCWSIMGSTRPRAWLGKAYFDANKLAGARSAGIYMDYGYTRPGVISRGPINQNAGREAGAVAKPPAAQPVLGENPEVIPPPQPNVPATDGPPPSEPAPGAKAVGPQAGGPTTINGRRRQRRRPPARRPNNVM